MASSMSNTRSDTRSHKKWSAEEDKILIASYKDNVKYDAIASTLKRSVDAVKCRLVKTYLYPNFIKLAFRDPNGELQPEVLTTHYDNIVRRFSILYSMTEADLGRYIWYADKDIKSEYDETEGYEGSDDSELTEDSDWSEGSEDSEGSEGSEGSKGSEDSDDTDFSETSDEEDTFTASMHNASKWKLKYYKLKYTNRLKTINDMLNKM
jgi:hypothetical protein